MKANPSPDKAPNPDVIQILTATIARYQAWVLAGRPEEA